MWSNKCGQNNNYCGQNNNYYCDHGAMENATSAARLQMIADVLKSMGIDDHERGVTLALNEFMHKYIAEILQDAAVYQEYAQKPELDLDDVRLAIQSKVNCNFVQPPPREFMIEMARVKNAVPLPLPRAGIHLPPAEHCHSAINYQITLNSRDAQQPSHRSGQPSAPTAGGLPSAASGGAVRHEAGAPGAQVAQGEGGGGPSLQGVDGGGQPLLTSEAVSGGGAV